MNEIKLQAVNTLNELHSSIPYIDYCNIMDGLQDIETLRDRDEETDRVVERTVEALLRALGEQQTT